MPAFMKRLTLLLAVAALCTVATDAVAQESARVLSSWDDPVKLSDGTETVYRYEVVYDYDTGIALRNAYDAAGTLVETVQVAPPGAPSAEEIEEARAIILADAAIAGVAARSNATVEGGFILFADQYPACAAPARCLQFDIMPPSKTESLQFVVVDLRTRTIIERDLFPDL